MNDYKFGNFVCNLREKRGMTQADLAKQLGLTPAAISKWENGSSKPRVEVLFQLAEILGVRPEELMEGHYIEENHLDPESIKLINEKYNYLLKIELHNTSKTKIFRLIAALIDWNAIGFVVLFAASFLLSFHQSFDTTPSTPYIILLFLLILSYPVCIVLRDLIFGGRSLGKRIMGLIVLDKRTGEAPKKSSLFLRGIFLFLVHAELVIMLITGLTLGDRMAHTIVVRKKDLDLTQKSISPETNTEMINRFASDEKARKRSNMKKSILWICIIVAAFILFVGFILISVNTMLNNTKETEEYKLAYSYVIESEKFDELGIAEEQLEFTSYSISSYPNGDKGTQRDARISFRISFGHEITVILHDEGDGWFVCRECTEFE